MKIIRFIQDNHPVYGILEGDDIFQMKGEICGDYHKGEKVSKINEVRLLPPVIPGTIIGVGLNYSGPIKQANLLVPAEPLLFLKASSCVIGPEEDIIMPEGFNDLRLEPELAVIIKHDARHVSEEKAMDYVLGFTCANDLTVPDLNNGSTIRNKSFYTSCPLGPSIATGIKSDDLNIRTILNGDLIGNDSTSKMIFGIEKLISYITGFMPLEPLDVILTGTPRGGDKLKEGDIVEVEIDGIGSLRNKVSR
ncbi:MAG: fumarylacetoacetate hydrolase family protein [Deltaproteobacteria bacterium]|nr:fumarylacetoacetate hydrolase family protein [Deltaproteobacteria bacterium]